MTSVKEMEAQTALEMAADDAAIADVSHHDLWLCEMRYRVAVIFLQDSFTTLDDT